MNSIPHYWACILQTISYLEDSRERVQALLSLKRPPVHDARNLQLVYSVERNAGHSGVVLARRAVKLLQLRDRSRFGDALMLLIDPSKMNAKENPKFDYSQALDGCKIIKDPDILAENLLVRGCWNVGIFADAVLRASGGNSLAARYLRAAGVHHGFLQELSSSAGVSISPTIASSPSSSEKVIIFKPKKRKVSSISEAN
jgi:hypothetical protein